MEIESMLSETPAAAPKQHEMISNSSCIEPVPLKENENMNSGSCRGVPVSRTDGTLSFTEAALLLTPSGNSTSSNSSRDERLSPAVEQPNKKRKTSEALPELASSLQKLSDLESNIRALTPFELSSNHTEDLKACIDRQIGIERKRMREAVEYETMIYTMHKEYKQHAQELFNQLNQYSKDIIEKKKIIQQRCNVFTETKLLINDMYARET